MMTDLMLLMQVGTPLTHQHFVRKHRGTYGHSMAAGKDDYRSSRTPLPGLLCCGDSTFPGIGQSLSAVP